MSIKGDRGAHLALTAPPGIIFLLQAYFFSTLPFPVAAELVAAEDGVTFDLRDGSEFANGLTGVLMEIVGLECVVSGMRGASGVDAELDTI